jgi:hypothetical protein
MRGPSGVWPSFLATCVLVLACGDDDTAGPGFVVSGPGSDASVRGDGAAPPTPLRPDEPRFPEADREIALPPGESVTVTLRLDAGVGALDVHLSVDTTESMSQEIDNLQRELSNKVVPGLLDRVKDVRFGVSRFEDFPHAPFGFSGDAIGNPSDVPFRLLTPITADDDHVAAAVASLDRPLGVGGDIPESSAEALWQIATGEGYRAGGAQIIEAFDPRNAESDAAVGGVGFRDDALRVVLHVTDAPSHGPRDYGTAFPDTHSLEQAAEALGAIDARVVGIVTRACTDGSCGPNDARARRDLEQVAHDTGAVVPLGDDDKCAHGIDGAPVPPYAGVCPLVYDVKADGSHLSDTLVDAIAALIDTVRFAEVHGEANADPLGFVSAILATELPQDDGVEAPATDDVFPTDAPDGTPDTFLDVRRKAALGFEVQLANRNVTPTDVEQRFRVVVRIVGDGVVLQERVVRVIVPPRELGPGSADADAG